MPNRTPTFLPLPFTPNLQFSHRNPREKKQSCHSLFLQGPRSTARMAKFTQIARRKRAERPFTAASAIFHPGRNSQTVSFAPPLPPSPPPLFPLPPRMNLTVSLRGSASLSTAIFRPLNHSPLLSCLSRLFVPQPARKQAGFLRRSISDPCKMSLSSPTARLSPKRGKANVRLPKQERSNYRPRK